MPSWEDVVEIGCRLPGVDPVELGELLEDAWRVFAAKRVVAAWDAEREGGGAA